MIAYLLAAGYATRLWPLTKDRAKPLLEVGGRPLLTHLVRRFEALPELEEIVVIGNARFAEDFSAWREACDSRVPITVLNDGSHDDDDKLGAIGDLAFALDRVPPGGRDFIVAAGDNLLAFDLGPLWDAFARSRDPLIALRTVEVGGGPSPYNEVTLADDGQVVGFREKPADPKTDLAAIALYFMPAEAAGLVGEYLAEGRTPDAPGHFIAWLVERRVVRGERFAGEWFDIGSHATLTAARARFASEEGPGPGPRE